MLVGCDSPEENDPGLPDATVTQDMGMPEVDSGIGEVIFEELGNDDLVFQPIVDAPISALWTLAGKRILWRADDAYYFYENGQHRSLRLDGFEIFHAVYIQTQLLVSTDQGLMVK